MSGTRQEEAPSFSELIDTEQIVHVLRQGMVGGGANLFVGPGYMYLAWPIVDHRALAAWLAFLAIISTLRMALARAVARGPVWTSLRGAKSLTLVAGTLAGLCWGIAAWLLMPFDPNHVNFILTSLVIAMWAGALGSFGSWHPSYFAYLLASMSPALGWMLFSGNRELVIASIGGFVFAVFLARVAHEISNTLRQAIRQRAELERLTRSLSQALDAAESANRAKSSFLVNMNHEIRTPLNAIIGLSDLMLESVRHPQNIEYVRVMRDAGLSLLGIIDNVLDLSRVEAGRLDIRGEPFDPHALVPRVVDMFRPEAGRKGLSLDAAIAPDVPRMMIGDANRIRQIMVNLVGNALKFTHSGGVKIRVAKAKPSPPGYFSLRIEVADTGPGIDPAAQKLLFQPFSQIDASSTRRYGGAGMGLNISAQLARLMGGEIGVDSEPGRGSTFWFTVTTELSADMEESNSPMAPEAPAPGRRRLRVLLAEDNDVNLFVTSQSLATFNCDVVAARSGLEALDKLSAGTFDLVLMDCQMREMDGYEATRQWREREAALGLPRTPIVALTANAVAGDRERCVAVGMDDYLTKPVRQTELGNVLARLTGDTGIPLPLDLEPLRVAEEREPPVDRTILNDLRRDMAGSQERMARIFTLYFDQGATYIATMREGAGLGDAEAMRRAAHSLKSGSAILGATRLAALCAELEMRCRAGHVEEARGLVDDIRGEYDQVCGVLRVVADEVSGAV